MGKRAVQQGFLLAIALVTAFGVSACNAAETPVAQDGADTTSAASKPAEDPFADKSEFWVFEANEDGAGEYEPDITKFWFYDPSAEASVVLRAPFPTESPLNADRELAIGFDEDGNVSIANLWTGELTTLDMADLTGNFRGTRPISAEFDDKDADLVHVTMDQYILWDVDLKHPDKATEVGQLLGTDKNMTACDRFYFNESDDWETQVARSRVVGEDGDLMPLEGDPVMAPALAACYARTGVLNGEDVAFYDSLPDLPGPIFPTNAWAYGTEDHVWSFQIEGEVTPTLRLYEASLGDSDWTLSKAEVPGQLATGDWYSYGVVAAPAGIAPAITD